MDTTQIVLPDFIAIDFETATKYTNSACAFGAVAIAGEEVIDQYYTLICPPDNEFDESNTALHGICAEDTKSAPSFRQAISWLLKYIDVGTPIVAHNASFDISVFDMSRGNLPVTNFKYVDTMDLTKPYVKGRRSLAQCTEHFEIELAHHHNALDDALACAKVALKCIELSPWGDFATYCIHAPWVKIRSLSDLKPIERISAGNHHTSESKWAAVKKNNVDPKSIVPCAGEKDCNHPLYGKNIVFTGTLSIDRGAAMQMASDVGAILKGGVSSKTDYLIVGTQDKSLVGEDGLSGKEEKAYTLNNSGKAHIEIINEDQFLALIGGEK